MKDVLRAVLSVGLVICFIPCNATETSSESTQRIINANRTEASYNSSSMLVRNAELDTYLADLVKRIIASTPEAASANFRIHAMRNTIPYVYCLDNAAIYISTGLLARLQNESQLASVIAPEIAAVTQQNAESKNKLSQKQGAASRVIPNLILIAATAGLAAIPIVEKNNTETQKLRDKLQLESDKLALQWLQQAGLDPAEAPKAMQRLLDTLTVENRFGTDFSKKVRLEERVLALQKAQPETVPATAAIDPKHFLVFSHRFAIELAESDSHLSDGPFYTVLNRIEAEQGIDGVTTFLRAEFIRERMIDDAQLSDVIRNYEACITHPDAPAKAFRELGFLQRRKGNMPAARHSFELYLQKQPNAVDAPIIRSYMESM